MVYGAGVGHARQGALDRLKQQQARARLGAISQLGDKVGGAIEQIRARKQQQAVQQDILNVQKGGIPTTAQGALLAQKMSDAAANRALTERQVGVSENREKRMGASRVKDELAAELEGRRVAADREARRVALAKALGVKPKPQWPEVGEAGSLIGGVAEWDPSKIKHEVPPLAALEAMREERGYQDSRSDAEARRGIEKSRAETARMVEERLGRPEDETSRRTRKAQMRKAEAEASKAEKELRGELGRDFPESKPMTISNALIKAVDTLKSKKDEEGYPIEFTKEEVRDIAIYYLTNLTPEAIAEAAAKIKPGGAGDEDDAPDYQKRARKMGWGGK